MSEQENKTKKQAAKQARIDTIRAANSEPAMNFDYLSGQKKFQMQQQKPKPVTTPVDFEAFGAVKGKKK